MTFDKAQWTLAQLVAWAWLRDRTLTNDVGASDNADALAAVGRLAHARRMEISRDFDTDVAPKIRAALQEGKLTATGGRDGRLPRAAVPVIEWQDLEIDYLRSGTVAVRNGVALPRWDDLRFSSGEARSIWLPTNPDPAFMSACEVIHWIAFGILRTSDDLRADDLLSIDRWGRSPVGPLLVALKARSAPEPFCAVVRILLEPVPDAPVELLYQDKALSHRGPAVLRRLRASFRHREGRLVTYGEITRRLEEELAIQAARDEQLKAAARDLLTAMRMEKLTALGQRDSGVARPNPGATHEPIPLEVLAHSAITVRLDDRVCADGPIELWINRHGPDFSDVRFKTREILKLWPAGNATHELVESETSTEQEIIPSRLRVVTKTALIHWIRENLDPDQLPARDTAFEMAKNHFSDRDLPRSDFRAAFNEIFGPQRQGPRTRRRNPPPNSANTPAA